MFLIIFDDFCDPKYSQAVGGVGSWLLVSFQDVAAA